MKKMKILYSLLLTVCVTGCLFKANNLDASWVYYKTHFINKEGRVIDYEKNSITTSEGQSYALLRAVLINDKITFDKVLKWTENNLNRKDDNLYAWIWGEKPDKSWGILDKNSASDADIDIATALILANQKWEQKSYLDKALPLINDIWEKETREINLQRVLSAGAKQNIADTVDINPSYFSPYAFRIFATYDKKHNWISLVNSSYDLISKISSATDTGLIPDWFSINPLTGQIYFDKTQDRSKFSYDAIRIYLRIYVDYLVSNDSRALDFLASANFFVEKYNQNPAKLFYTFYKADGELLSPIEDTGAIAVLNPAVSLISQKTAQELIEYKIQNQYHKEGYWYKPDVYYLQNLVWLSLWVQNNESEIKNLYGKMN